MHRTMDSALASHPVAPGSILINVFLVVSLDLVFTAVALLSTVDRCLIMPIEPI